MLPHSTKPLKMKAHLTSSFAHHLVRQNQPHQIQNSGQYKFQTTILEENFHSKYFLQTCILSHIRLYSIKVNVPGPIILAATLSGEQVFENVQRANQASLHMLLNQVDQQRKKSTQNCNKQKQSIEQENFVFNSEPQVSSDKLLTSRAERLSMQVANKLFHFKVLKSISVVCVILSR